MFRFFFLQVNLDRGRGELENDIRKLLISHFRTFCFSKCCSQREEIRLTSNSYRKRTTFSSSNQH